MNFVDEINKIQDNFDNKVAKINEDIIDYFKKYLDGDVFRNHLRNEIAYQINKGKEYITVSVDFWEYSPGCSETYIECAFKRYSLEHQDNKIDGIRLRDIHKPLCRTIYRMLSNKLQELGFKIITTGVNESRFDYFKEYITITWKGEK